VQHFYEHFRAQMRFEGFSLSNLKIESAARSLPPCLTCAI